MSAPAHPDLPDDLAALAESERDLRRTRAALAVIAAPWLAASVYLFADPTSVGALATVAIVGGLWTLVGIVHGPNRSAVTWDRYRVARDLDPNAPRPRPGQLRLYPRPNVPAAPPADHDIDRQMLDDRRDWGGAR